MRRKLLSGLMPLLLAGSLAFMAGCSDTGTPTGPENGTSGKNDGSVQFVGDVNDAPTLSCEASSGSTITLRLTAGATGAPAGFYVQWIKSSDYVDENSWFSSNACSATLSGLPQGSRFNVAANGYVDVTLGSMPAETGLTVASGCNSGLVANTDYMIRAFAVSSNAQNGRGESAASQTLTSNSSTCGSTTTTLSVPSVDCNGGTATSLTVTITAGADPGAPAGYTLQWRQVGNANWTDVVDNAALAAAATDAQTINGLTSGVSYEFRVKANGNDTYSETAYSSTETCTTVPTLLTPSLACGTATETSVNVIITAGATYGAPYGYTLQWKPSTEASWANATTEVNNSSIGAGGQTTFLVENLTAGTAYDFRVKANGSTGNYVESALSSTRACSTSTTTGGGCTYTQGYWKNHEEDWPVESLTLGTVSYDKTQLLNILNQPVQGNGLISLAHQLIAAKLNVENGASDAAVASAISTADNLIGGRVVPPVGNGSLTNGTVNATKNTLDNYNNGIIGPGHCD